MHSFECEFAMANIRKFLGNSGVANSMYTGFFRVVGSSEVFVLQVTAIKPTQAVVLLLTAGVSGLWQAMPSTLQKLQVQARAGSCPGISNLQRALVKLLSCTQLTNEGAQRVRRKD